MSKLKITAKDMESFLIKDQFFYIHNEGKLIGTAKKAPWKITLFKMRGLYAVAWYNPKNKDENHIVWKNNSSSLNYYAKSAGIKVSNKTRYYEKARPSLSPSEYIVAERFNKEMVKYANEYRDFLLKEKPVAEVTERLNVVQGFVHYLFSHHLISSLDQITVSIANSRFHVQYNFIYREPVNKPFFKKTIKDFFTFLYGKYGIRNEKLMKGFNK